MLKLKLQDFDYLMKSWLIWKDPDSGKDWRQEEKGTTEDEMVVWHHWLNGHEFEQALGVGNGQGSLACYSPWGWKELDMTEQISLSFSKEINLEYSLQRLMLKLKLQYFVKNQVIGKDTDAGKDWGQKEKRTSEDDMAE